MPSSLPPFTGGTDLCYITASQSTECVRLILLHPHLESKSHPAASLFTTLAHNSRNLGTIFRSRVFATGTTNCPLFFQPTALIPHMASVLPHLVYSALASRPTVTRTCRLLRERDAMSSPCSQPRISTPSAKGVLQYSLPLAL